MDTFQFNQEACDACKTFAETTNTLFDQWCSSCATNGGNMVDSVQENNPVPPTASDIFARPGVD